MDSLYTSNFTKYIVIILLQITDNSNVDQNDGYILSKVKTLSKKISEQNMMTKSSTDGVYFHSEVWFTAAQVLFL